MLASQPSWRPRNLSVGLGGSCFPIVLWLEFTMLSYVSVWALGFAIDICFTLGQSCFMLLPSGVEVNGAPTVWLTLAIRIGGLVEDPTQQVQLNTQKLSLGVLQGKLKQASCKKLPIDFLGP